MIPQQPQERYNCILNTHKSYKTPDIPIEVHSPYYQYYYSMANIPGAFNKKSGLFTNFIEKTKKIEDSFKKNNETNNELPVIHETSQYTNNKSMRKYNSFIKRPNESRNTIKVTNSLIDKPRERSTELSMIERLVASYNKNSEDKEEHEMGSRSVDALNDYSCVSSEIKNYETNLKNMKKPIPYANKKFR